MKKIILGVFLSFGLTTAFAQKIKESVVPVDVKAGLKKHFPNAKLITWEKEGANFEAEFDMDKVKTSVLLNISGDLLETETAIAVSSLPKTAIEYLAKTYKGEKIEEAAKIVEADGKIKYEAEVKGKDI